MSGPQTLEITRIAETLLSSSDVNERKIEHWMELDPNGSDAEQLSEFAGRACYQSWEKPNPATATTAGYIDHILDVGHFSVLAHASVSYYITGVSRTLTHELVRHRWPAFSQLSQRYVKLDDGLPYVIPPLCRGDEQAEDILYRVAFEANESYQELVRCLTRHHPDAKPKQIREAARAVLPGMTETRIVVSANLRAWRDLLSQRLPKTADAEIQELAQGLLTDLESYAPEVFGDLVDLHLQG